MDDSGSKKQRVEEPAKVHDKRRFLDLDDEEVEPGDDVTSGDETSGSALTELEAMRSRAEAAEAKLYTYAAGLNQLKAEQEQIRVRLERDVAAKVDTRFGALAADLLEAVDDLERALEHARTIPAAEAIVQGLEIARDRFLAMLLKNGLARLDLESTDFDPNTAEAIAVEPVTDATLEGKVVRVVRPGFRLGDRIVRPARVTVGRLSH